MRKLSSIITCMVCIITLSCINISEQYIEKEISSVVVLNQNYYKLEFSNDENLFFSNYDEKGGITGTTAEEYTDDEATSYITDLLFHKMDKL